MNKLFYFLGLLCILLLPQRMSAQDVTAQWDFQNGIPSTITSVAVQGRTGVVASDVDGILLTVDATNGKLAARSNGDAQFNSGTIIQVPVKHAKDEVTVVSDGAAYTNYTIGGIEATEVTTTHIATAAEAKAGYVEIIGTGSSYLRRIVVVQKDPRQEKALYTTDFTDWPSIDRKANNETPTTQSVTTLYSNETLTFTLCGVGVDPAGKNDAKFTTPTFTGYMQSAKYTAEVQANEPYAMISAIKNLTKIVFHQAATGGRRGWAVAARKAGTTEWTTLFNQSITTTTGENDTIAIPADLQENVEVKFYNFNLNQNAYMSDLALYGLVDLSNTPMLESLTVNGQAYSAIDIFSEAKDGSQTATLEVSKSAKMPSADNPVTAVASNGTVGTVTYTTKDDMTVVTIPVTLNGLTTNYIATFVWKPDYTLTYYASDGTTVLGTQTVEKDAAISSFAVADPSVEDGYKFRGWTAQAGKGKKYTTSDVVTSDLSLYALVTAIETANDTARYDYSLCDEFFDPADHEAFTVSGTGKFHDANHGWVFNNGDKIQLLLGAKGYIKLTLCKYTNVASTIDLLDSKGNTIATTQAQSTSDGDIAILNYSGEVGTYTLSFNGSAYLHALSIVNLGKVPFTQTGNWYVVKSGDATGLLTALECAGTNTDERKFIFLPNGTYDFGNKVLNRVSGKNISLIGESEDGVVLVNKPETEGINVTATLYNKSTGLYLQDLTLKNNYPFNTTTGATGRAVCLQDEGTQTICKNVKMLSFQDTYYSHNNSKGQYYFENSEIHGIVDYLCGDGDAYFKNCVLFNEAGKSAHITANATSSNYGYVFDGCTVKLGGDDQYDFGRAWNGAARVAFLNTTLAGAAATKIRATRWEPNGMNVMPQNFWEYNSMDENGNVISPASNVVDFTFNNQTSSKETILPADQVSNFALDKVFTNWTPAAFTLQCAAPVVTLNGGSLSWTAVDGASTYLIFRNGSLVTITEATSFDTTAAATTSSAKAATTTPDVWTVRAANVMGGLGTAGTATLATAIRSITEDGNRADTPYYNIGGQRVSQNTCGLLIHNGKKVIK
ncbi:pectinesterase family protein [Prevotella sp. AGR2160]|uniref:pectinesterase family protein n=1 Tax=Prevotella sp. AGR2160 TaxID=1280674 RepID=UPI0004198070|nr:pectinesterase family protein [Prevotella sp. AGR2160]